MLKKWRDKRAQKKLLITAYANNIIEKKSLGFGGGSFNEFLSFRGFHSLSTIITLEMYAQAMPFYNAVNTRASYFSQIPVRVFNTETEEYDDDHEALNLLSTPNADVTGNEFLYQLSSYLDITGDCFIVATGRLNAPPIELVIIPPQNVTFSSGDNRFRLLGVPESITINSISGLSQNFRAVEEGDRIRYINGDMQEVWHIRSFNPFRTENNFWGMSPAQPLFLELQQYIEGNSNNLSLLKRGSRPSLAWVNKRPEPLTDEQLATIREEAEKYASSVNAGRTPILDGMEIQTFSLTNTDMQFKELQQSVFSRINNVYGIPLAKLLDSVMTLSNLETSTLQLYDDAIIPLSSYVYAELTRFLMPRYPDSENKIFQFNPNDIEALRVRSIEMTKKQGEIGVNTINELRTLLGYESLSSGGDQLWRPMGDAPIADDLFIEDNLLKPQNKAISEQFVSRRRSDILIKKGYM